jgi:hypothetical protein
LEAGAEEVGFEAVLPDVPEPQFPQIDLMLLTHWLQEPQFEPQI